MPEMILGNGMVTIVDQDIYDKYNQYIWSADLDRTTGNYYVCRKFYIGPWTDGKRYKARLHRLVIGASKGQMVDHINHDTLDNRLENLRIVTNSQNRMNIRKSSKKRTSQYKGVYWSKQYNKFVVQIRLNKKLYTFGKFDNENDAALCYNINAIKMFVEFACLNEL